MRCSSKKYTILIFLVSVFLFGCSNTDPAVPYGMLSNDTNYTFGVQGDEQTVKMFAEDLCAADSNITDTSSINYSGIYSAAVYDINSLSVLYSYNATTRVNPASITKIMTALIILENMNLDENITVPDVTISEGGVQLFKLNEGDISGARDLFNVMLHIVILIVDLTGFLHHGDDIHAKSMFDIYDPFWRRKPADEQDIFCFIPCSNCLSQHHQNQFRRFHAGLKSILFISVAPF